MTAMRAPNREFLEEETSIGEPLITVGAGEALMIRVGAIDRQSGVAEVVASCRSRENHELSSSGTWTAGRGRHAPDDNYYSVAIPIPARSPTVIWELHRITLCDREGNRRSYNSGKDFEGMFFQVQGKPEFDCAPPRLLGVRIVRP